MGPIGKVYAEIVARRAIKGKNAELQATAYSVR